MHALCHDQRQTLTNSSCIASFVLPVLSISPGEFTHIELGDTIASPEVVGRLWLEKPCHHGFSVDAHKGYNFVEKGTLSCGLWL